MAEITIQNEALTIDVSANANLREALAKSGISVYSGPSRLLNCHGHGLCGTCEVLVIEGAENLSERTPREIRKLRTYDRHRRLACQAAVVGDGHVVLHTNP